MIKNNNNFVNESLSLYKELCTPITSRESFFNDCVQNRLDYLLNSNSNYILKLFKSYNKSYLMSTKLLRQLVKKL